MFRAIQEGDLELVRYYLSTGVDPNYQHPEYLAAPLVEGVRYQRYDVVKLLIEKGADPNIIEVPEGDSPLKVALRLGNQLLVQLIQESIRASDV